MDLQNFLDERAAAFLAEPELQQEENEIRALVDAEARLHIERLRQSMRKKREADQDLDIDDDDFDDDDYDVDVEYVR
jgi:GTP-binding protein